MISLISYNNKKIFKTYVKNQRFGPYYIPVRFQNQLLKKYCEDKNMIFALSIGEITFSETHIQLRSLLDSLKKNQGILFMSVYVLPTNKNIFENIIKIILKKKIECHFLIENIIIKNKNDIKKLHNFFKLKKIFN